MGCPFILDLPILVKSPIIYISVKGVMDDKTFVLISDQFKRERNQLKETQQKVQKNLRPPGSSRTVSQRFRKEAES